MKYLIILLFLTPLFSKAQTTFDSSFHFYYYDQKLSMFEKAPTPKKPIVWLGDSITDGGEWSEFFPNLNTLNRGVSADNTFGILNRLYEVIQRKPKKVFLLIGINDIARNIPDSIIIRNYKKIIDSFKIKSPTTRLYVQSILPTNNAFTNFANHQNKTEHILYINNALQKLCLDKNVTYIDLYTAFLDKENKLDKEYTNDGLHLLGTGYQKWKQVLIDKKLL